MTKNSRNTAVYKLYELFSSMRFAIGLLTILAIASIIGTVLKQNEPYPSNSASTGLPYSSSWACMTFTTRAGF